MPSLFLKNLPFGLALGRSIFVVEFGVFVLKPPDKGLDRFVFTEFFRGIVDVKKLASRKDRVDLAVADAVQQGRFFASEGTRDHVVLVGRCSGDHRTQAERAGREVLVGIAFGGRRTGGRERFVRILHIAHRFFLRGRDSCRDAKPTKTRQTRRGSLPSSEAISCRSRVR